VGEREEMSSRSGGRDAPFPLVSVNDHLLEPPHLFSEHMSASWRDLVPRVIDLPDGTGQAWRFEDRVYPVRRLATVAGEDPSTFDMRAARYEDLKAGSWNPSARVTDMDADGVQVHTCLPTVLGFAGTLLSTLSNRELARACALAYNDYVLDEWCAYAPDRLVPVAVLPFWDVELARDEAERVFDRGISVVTFPEDPTALGLPSFHESYWDPMLAVIEEAGAVLCLHMNSVPLRLVEGKDTPRGAELSLMYCSCMATMTNLLFSPIFLDFPGLKVLLAESGLGWIPFILEKSDFLWDRHRAYGLGPRTSRQRRPSDLYTDHIYVTFMTHDDEGIRERHVIGINQILWQCDYPHSDSSWPLSRKLLREALRDVSEPEKRLMLGGNAQSLLHLDARA
jgi:predicted TIM-barrel fold metal-dependent hydrolase